MKEQEIYRLGGLNGVCRGGLFFGGDLIHRFAVPLLRGRRQTSSTASRSPFSGGEGERAGQYRGPLLRGRRRAGGGRNSEFRITLSLFVEDSHTLMVGGGVRPHNTEQEDISWQPFRTKRR